MAHALGIDIAKRTFAAALWRGGQGQGLGSFANTAEGFAALRARLATLLPGEELAALPLVLEPTGGYELPLAYWAHAQGWPVSLPNPRHVRDWAKGLGRRAKTDAQDALTLARYGAERAPHTWQPLPAEVAELESLLRRKDDLEGMLQQERNRRGALAGRPGVAGAVPGSVDRVIGLLEEELRALEQAIKAHQRQHASIRLAAERLRSVPGIGAKTVLHLVVLLHRWQTLTGGQGRDKGLVAYVGLDPQPHESGTSVHGHATISRLGARGLRRRLFMAALGGTRRANPLRRFYRRLVDRGKAKKLALVAAARKLLTWAWAVFRRQQPFAGTPADQPLAVTA
jgi:transposase